MAIANAAARDKPFAEAAPQYAAHGLRVFPVGGEDGKRPLINSWPKVGRRTFERLSLKFATANVAVIDGDPGGIVRVDIDDPDLVEMALDRFGDTPVKVQTPTPGHRHLWYRSNGERRVVGLDGLKIDILGRGGYGVAPPSIFPGKGVYSFIEGGLDDLDHLLVIRPGALPPTAYRNTLPPANDTGRVPEGCRIKALFAELRVKALDFETPDELQFYAEALNEAKMDPILTEAEIRAQVRGVWRLKTEGRLILPGSRTAVVPLDVTLRLAMKGKALALYTFLSAHHGPDHRFQVSPKGIGRTLGLAPGTVRVARNVLLAEGLLRLVERAKHVHGSDGTWSQSPDLYRLSPGFKN